MTLDPGLQEEDLRLLQAEREGVAQERAVTFLGQDYPVAGTGLVALLRYASQRADPTGQVGLAAAHQVLEECLGEHFRNFTYIAIEGKAGFGDVEQAVQQIIEVHCARPWRASLRLLGYAAANLAEIDGGMLAATGRGLNSLTPRQLCNLVFAQLISACKDEEAREEFMEDLYLDFDPEAEARRLAEEMIASQGG